MAISDNVKLLRKKFLNCFILDFLFIFLSNGVLIQTHYSPDTYAQIISSDNSIGVNFNNSRFFYAFILKFINILGVSLSIPPIPNILTFIYFILISVIITYFTYLINKYTVAKSIDLQIINISFVLAFNNVFILEWYFFSECILMYTFCLLFCILSIAFFVNQKNNMYYLISFIFLILAINTYQVAIGFYITFGVLFICLQNHFQFTIKVFKKLIILCSIGAVACIINQIFAVLFINDLNSTRHATISINKIINNIKEILYDHIFIWIEGTGLLPRYSMLLFLLILLVLLIYTFKKNIAFCLLLILGSYITVFIPHIFLSDIWISQRSIAPFFSIFTLLIIFIVVRLSSKLLKKGLLILVSSFLVLNTIQMQDITMNHFAANKLDIEYALLIQQEIDRYEKMNNTLVTNIGICNDKISTYGYRNNIKYQSRDINKRAFITPWEFIPTLNVVNKRNYMQIPVDKEIYNRYYKDKNWDLFYPQEQMVFINDTVYIVMY